MRARTKSIKTKAQFKLVNELSKVAHFSGNKEKLKKVLSQNPKLVHSLIGKLQSEKELNELIRLFTDEGHIEVASKGKHVTIKYIPNKKKTNFLRNFRDEMKNVFDSEEFEPKVPNVTRRRSLTELGLSKDVVNQINSMVEEESMDI